MIDLSSLRNPTSPRKDRKRVGRGPGSGKGKTCGKGHKGQKARSGYSRRAGFEGGQMPLHRRLPKRGFHHQKRFPFAVVNVDALDRLFDEGAEVSSEAILKAGIGASPSGPDACKGGVKVLGRGACSKRLHLKVNAVSPGARQKIEAAGGTVELIGVSNKDPQLLGRSSKAQKETDHAG